MKSVARTERDSLYNLALAKLNDFFQKGVAGDAITDDDRADAFKLTKQVTVPTYEMLDMVIKWMVGEGIKFVGAPFEAEWQLVMLEKSCEIDAIMSVDGDCVILGAKKLYVDVKFSEKKLRVYHQSAVVKPGSMNLLTRYPTELWPLVAPRM